MISTSHSSRKTSPKNYRNAECWVKPSTNRWAVARKKHDGSILPNRNTQSPYIVFGEDNLTEKEIPLLNIHDFFNAETKDFLEQFNWHGHLHHVPSVIISSDGNNFIKGIRALSNSNLFIYGNVSPLETLIVRAKKMLALSYDWDNDGALPIDEELYNKTISFLRAYYNFTISKYNQIQLPDISPCPDGSIDLDWLTPNAKLLVNISKDDNGDYVAYYYGDKHNNKVQIKGSTPISEFSEHLAVWMKYLT